MWQAEFKLFLYPENPDMTLKSHQLIELLAKQAFIGKKLSDKRFSTGENFTSLLTFMGCSPNIELEPQENAPYCYIEIEKSDFPLFISGQNLKKAKCPHCKEPLSLPECPACNTVINPQTLNWRKTAFIASCWIAVGNIYELEAIPSDQLLNNLEKESGVRWKPAYIRIKSA